MLGYGHESPGHPSQCANEVAVATEAQICMRAGAHRLEVLLVCIETPFRTSVERCNDGRTPAFLQGSISVCFSAYERYATLVVPDACPLLCGASPERPPARTGHRCRAC